MLRYEDLIAFAHFIPDDEEGVVSAETLPAQPPAHTRQPDKPAAEPARVVDRETAD